MYSQPAKFTQEFPVAMTTCVVTPAQVYHVARAVMSRTPAQVYHVAGGERTAHAHGGEGGFSEVVKVVRAAPTPATS